MAAGRTVGEGAQTLVERFLATWSGRTRFVRANLLQGLPFADDRFDFVHQRALAWAVPVRSWPVLVQDLVRVAAPGGWVELVEGQAEFEPAAPRRSGCTSSCSDSARHGDWTRPGSSSAPSTAT